MNWLSVIQVAIPILAVVVGWLINEHSKRGWEEYLRKEANYRALLTALKGFYVKGGSYEQKAAFLEQVNLCWLYCPDDVIRKAYAFLDTVHTDTAGKTKSGEAESAMGDFVAAIRKDLLSREITRKTSLGSTDFKRLVVT